MITFDDVTKVNTKEHNPNLPKIPNHPYRILTVRDIVYGKINALLNAIYEKPDIDNIYLCAKDPYKAKCQFFINERESTGIKIYMIQKLLLSTRIKSMIFTKNIEEQNPNKKQKNFNCFWWCNCQYA